MANPGTQLIRTRLLSLPAVTALVAQRIYVLMLPQNFGQQTGILLQRISERSTVHLHGTGGQWVERVQVDSLAPSLSQAYAIDVASYGDGAGSALAGFVGDISTAHVQSILPDTIRESFEGAEVRTVRLMRDYFITFTEVRT